MRVREVTEGRVSRRDLRVLSTLQATQMKRLHIDA
jgi:hypothetical protein